MINSIGERFRGKKDSPKKQKDSQKSGDTKKGKNDTSKEAGRKIRFAQSEQKQTNERVSDKPKHVGAKSKANANGKPGSNPSNKTGLKQPKRVDPFVNFGPVVQEFLDAKQLRDKGINMEYIHTTSEMKITLSYREVEQNGVSLKKTVREPLEDYLSKRDQLLKRSDKNNRFLSFLEKLVERLGIDLTASRIHVDPESVIKFINSHLSPIEREVVKLTPTEWDQVDSAKLKKMLEPANRIVAEHYVDRTEFLLKSINSEEPDLALQPINWFQAGLGACTKGTLMETVRVQKESDPGLKDKLAKLAEAGFVWGDDDDTEEITGLNASPSGGSTFAGSAKGRDE